MKKLFLLSMSLFLAVCFNSCQKNKMPLITSSSLTIVNAVNGAGSLLTNFDREHKLTYYKNARLIDSSGFFQFSGYSGRIPLQLVQYADTTRQVFGIDLDIKPGSMQTLFLTGTLEKPDTALVKDQPNNYTVADSLAGIRFANLSPGSAGISVSIIGTGSKVVIDKLPYKSVSGFLSFEMKKNVPASHSYIFEFRDITSGSVLAVDTINQFTSLRAKNITLALIGLQAKGTQGIALINNSLLDLGGI